MKIFKKMIVEKWFLVFCTVYLFRFILVYLENRGIFIISKVSLKLISETDVLRDSHC